MSVVMFEFLIYEDDFDHGKISLSEIKEDIIHEVQHNINALRKYGKIKGTEKAGPTQSMPASTGFKEGMRTKSKSGKPMIFRNGQWEYE